MPRKPWAHLTFGFKPHLIYYCSSLTWWEGTKKNIGNYTFNLLECFQSAVSMSDLGSIVSRGQVALGQMVSNCVDSSVDHSLRWWRHDDELKHWNGMTSQLTSSQKKHSDGRSDLISCVVAVKVIQALKKKKFAKPMPTESESLQKLWFHVWFQTEERTIQCSGCWLPILSQNAMTPPSVLQIIFFPANGIYRWPPKHRECLEFKRCSDNWIW